MFQLKKVKNFIFLDSSQKVLLLEAYYYLALARFMKARPFTKLAPILGKNMEETSTKVNFADREMLWRISDAILIMSGYTFWESKCLVKAIAGMKMLKRRKIESTLYLGTAKDDDGKLIAHAWLRSGPFYITGKEEMKRFTVVGKFAQNEFGITKRRSHE
ncbi:MAG: lasso peptide biosynthesis B2 protein [Bacillota bacterium]|nr:lasso peptide biosynthesis B2 protein [Bacillota bacterium]